MSKFIVLATGRLIRSVATATSLTIGVPLSFSLGSPLLRGRLFRGRARAPRTELLNPHLLSWFVSLEPFFKGNFVRPRTTSATNFTPFVNGDLVSTGVIHKRCIRVHGFRLGFLCSGQSDLLLGQLWHFLIRSQREVIGFDTTRGVKLLDRVVSSVILVFQRVHHLVRLRETNHLGNVLMNILEHTAWSFGMQA